MTLLPLIVVALALALRAWPLEITGSRFPWLTFYPAVMAAAVFCGVWSGLAATLLSAIAVWQLWPALLSSQPIRDQVDLIGLAVFVFNCVLISLIAEGARRAKVQALEAREQADKANRAKSAFLANMSHELRTPLNVVLGYSRLLRSGTTLSPAQAAGLETITRSGEHLLSLIDNILDLAKIESGRAVPEKNPAHLPGLLKEVHLLLRATAEEKRLNLELQLAPDLPNWVQIDSRRVRQILLNLVGNALKFTDAGSVVLRVQPILRSTRAEPWLRFEVEDTGPGLTLEEQHQIFRPFVQVGVQPRRNDGTGLGLSIAKETVELLDGTIGLRSTPGRGSVFHFELPIVVLADVQPPAPDTPLQVVGLAPGQPRRRLLVVEDEPANRQLLLLLLQPLGFDVRVAEHGNAAVAIAATWHPHLIWMDIRMAGMDGITATRAIRQQHRIPAPVIIAVSAHAMEEECSKILAAGCDAIIRKPYQAAEVFAALEHHLGVQLIRAAEARPAPPEPAAEFTAAELSALPPTARRQLREAMTLLDPAGCHRAIAAIPPGDAALVHRLRCAVHELRFQGVLAALDDLVRSETSARHPEIKSV
jgi:signal transduction histidine kinase/CheY-like chemotaxis protein